MSRELDAAYGAQRRRLANTVQAAAAAVWTQGFRDRERVIAEVLALVTGGQAQVVSLVDAYMAAKAESQGQRGRVRGLDPNRYTVTELRGRPAEEVYDRPFGALGGQLAAGAEFASALTSARSSLTRLAATDLQLAHVRSARDWMADEDGIVGYQRVTAAKACGLCLAASTRRYHKADLLPIHEHCNCSVSPIYGTEPVAAVIDPDTWRVVKDQAAGDLSARNLSRLHVSGEELPGALRIVRDPELGNRLVDEAWPVAA